MPEIVKGEANVAVEYASRRIAYRNRLHLNRQGNRIV